MKGGTPGQTDWDRLTAAPLPKHYPDFAALSAVSAHRYPDVRHFMVWNEFKGFFDEENNRWDAEAYTELYNQVYEAVKLAFRTSRTQYRPPPWRFSAWCVGAGPVAVR